MGRPLVIEWREDAAELREAYRRERDAEVRPRLQALWLVREGRSLREVAALVGVHYVTLQRWVAWYRAGGLAEVRRHKNGGRQGRAPFLAPGRVGAFAARARQGAFRTAEDARAWLRAELGVAYTRGGIYSLLARLGWKPKRPRPQAMTTSAEVQEAWKRGGSPAPSPPAG
jgi:transposase